MWINRHGIRDPAPTWRATFVIAFTGVRGAVSLAAALALPFALPGGEGFPYRDLILFVSFGVIFITLVGLGLGLPPVVRWLGVADAGRAEKVAEHESEIAARREALAAALKSLDAITDDREVSDEVVKLLRARHETRTNQLPDSLDPDAHDVSAAGTDLTRELIASERKFIHVLLRDGKITDEIRRRIERDLDLEEASLANREYRTDAAVIPVIPRTRGPIPRSQLTRSADAARATTRIVPLRGTTTTPPRRSGRAADIAGLIAEALDHHRGQILGLVRHAGAGAHGVAVLMREMRRRLALLQRAGGFHHQLAEMHDAEIGRAEMLAGAVGDRALAVLHRGVLFGHALDAGVAVGLLQLAVDQIVVGLVAQRHVVLVDHRHHAVAAGVAVALGLRQRPLRIPGIGVDPAAGIGRPAQSSGRRCSRRASNSAHRHGPASGTGRCASRCCRCR